MPNQRNIADSHEVLGLLGIGLDGEDGHRRVTTGDHFILVGGSEQTHEQMIDTAIHLNEELQRRGKTLRDASPEEILDIFRSVSE